MAPKQILAEKRRRTWKDLPEDIFLPPEAIVDTETDTDSDIDFDEDELSEDEDTGMIWEQQLGRYGNNFYEDDNEPLIAQTLTSAPDNLTPEPPSPPTTTTTIYKQAIDDLQQEHLGDLRKIFLQCVKPEKPSVVESILDTYVLVDSIMTKETHLCDDMNLDPEETVFACQKDSGFYCQVPQCGAVYDLDYPFAIQLHLEAHGSMQWFCGEAGCNNAKTPYHNKQAMNDHLSAKHMNSANSRRAVRRVPMHEVSMSQLSGMLNFLPVPTQDGMAYERDLRDQGTLAFEPKYMVPEWQNWLKLGRMKKYTPREDFHIGSYYDEEAQAYVLMRPPVTQWPMEGWTGDFHLVTIPAEVRGSEYTHEMLKIVEIYHNFCMEIGTYAPETVLASLRRELGLKDGGPGLRFEDYGRQPWDGHYELLCPWPGCFRINTSHSLSAMAHHFLVHHLGCIWWCHEKECELYCAYRRFSSLERHRMFCHVGASLQCGHKTCNQVLVVDWNSRGHMTDRRLQQHDESIFNATLVGMRQSLETKGHAPSNQDVPPPSEYRRMFQHHSSSFFTSTQRNKRRKQNSKVLAKYKLTFTDTRTINHSICGGFYQGQQHFRCADSVVLSLETTRLLFVPTKMCFTVASTCDFCVFAMSMLHRPLADNPYATSSGRRGKDLGTPKRRGIGSSVTDYDSLCEFTARSPLALSPKAERYRSLKKSAPHEIFIVDFESVAAYESGLPLIPTEITVRDGEGQVIVSCIINDKGRTNAQFEDMMETVGYTNRKSFESARRIRGPKNGPLRADAKTSKEILQILRDHGLNPTSFWVEWSISAFDVRCMERLVEAAGQSPTEILPSRPQCWTVCADFMKALPGKRTG
jgi:hypothetical protein